MAEAVIGERKQSLAIDLQLKINPENVQNAIRNLALVAQSDYRSKTTRILLQVGIIRHREEVAVAVEAAEEVAGVLVAGVAVEEPGEGERPSDQGNLDVRQ